ncbi:unnamed protein product [Caenorhabditis auriculariae]|uniref:Glutathione S-transferase n=1 Tax=Caenorhabditis auriculariae TaxID=2777116 RepID=A0A8S1HRI1_9PELO|nr:unnamed protein product [Caenorhabditis auriculariae]
MVHYKLYYFDIRGLAEPIRMLFKLAKVDFDEVRYSFEEWPAAKKTTPFGKVPVLEIDGAPNFQSLAITRYLAHKFGFGGKDLEEQLLVDSWSEQQRELLWEFHRPYVNASMFEIKPKEEQAKILENLRIEFEKWTIKVEGQLKISGSGFIAPSGLTYVDLQIVEFATSMKIILPDSVEKFPQFLDYYKSVHEVPEIKEHFPTFQMPHYKLIYFDFRGLCEPIRMLFRLGHTEYEDFQLSFDERNTLKSTTPWGKVPVLEIDGEQYFQSLAIARYLAHKFGFGGKSLEEQLLVDGWAEQQREFAFEYFKPYVMATVYDVKPLEEQKKETKYFEKGSIDWLKRVVEQVEKSGSGFLAPCGLTYADLFVADQITTMKNLFADTVIGIPGVEDYYRRVHDVPEIKKYVETRKHTVI